MSNFGGRVDRYDFQSMAYTVKYGRLRAVFLQNYPAYERKDYSRFKSTMEYLKAEIEYADSVNAYLLLNMHDFGDQWPSLIQEFQAVVNGSRVVGIMSGHWHHQGGFSPGDLS